MLLRPYPQDALHGVVQRSVQTSDFNETVTDQTDVWAIGSASIGAAVLIWGLLAFFFGSFVVLVLVDMARKRETGELRGSFVAIGMMFLLLLKALICLLLKCSELGRLCGTHRKAAPVDVEAGTRDVLNSQAVIDRLAGQTHPKTKTDLPPIDEKESEVKNPEVKETPAEASSDIPTPGSSPTEKPPSRPSSPSPGTDDVAAPQTGEDVAFFVNHGTWTVVYLERLFPQLE